MKKYLSLVFLAGLITASCASKEVNTERDTFSGKYMLAYHVSVFYPDSANEKWWIDSGISDDEFKTGNYTAVCFKDATVEGKISDKGNFGPRGDYNRSLNIISVIKQTKIDCKDFYK